MIYGKIYYKEKYSDYESYWVVNGDSESKIIKQMKHSIGTYWLRQEKYTIKKYTIVDWDTRNEIDVTNKVLEKKKRNPKLGRMIKEKSTKDTIDKDVLDKLELVSEIKDVSKEHKTDAREYWD